MLVVQRQVSDHVEVLNRVGVSLLLMFALHDDDHYSLFFNVSFRCFFSMFLFDVSFRCFFSMFLFNVSFQRLCTAKEACFENVGKGTGCNFDHHNVW